MFLREDNKMPVSNVRYIKLNKFYTDTIQKNKIWIHEQHT